MFLHQLTAKCLVTNCSEIHDIARKRLRTYVSLSIMLPFYERGCVVGLARLGMHTYVSWSCQVGYAYVRKFVLPGWWSMRALFDDDVCSWLSAHDFSAIVVLLDCRCRALWYATQSPATRSRQLSHQQRRPCVRVQIMVRWLVSSNPASRLFSWCSNG